MDTPIVGPELDKWAKRKAEDEVLIAAQLLHQFLGLVKKDIDWMASREDAEIWAKNDRLLFYTDNESRDLVVWIVVKDCDEDLGDGMGILAHMIAGREEFGWNDLDAVEWNIKWGHTFHGFPEELKFILKITGFKVDMEGRTHGYARIQCTDWAS